MAFTDSQLLRIQQKANEKWADNRTRADYIADCDVVKAINEQQTAILDPLTDPAKTRTVRIMWLKACNMTTGAVGNSCAISGPELSSDSEDYTLNLSQKTDFSVKEFATRTDEFTVADQIAIGMLNADKLLCNWLGTQAVATLEAHRGTNTYTTPVGSTPWTFASSDTTIPADQWTTSLMPKLSLAARKNKFLSPYIISGEALWYTNEEARNNAGNGEGKGDATRMSGKYFSNVYFDPMCVDAATSPALKAYMVDRGALAFVSKTHFPSAPVTYQNPFHQRYKIKSKNLPFVDFEVIYTQACVSSEVTHTFQVSVNCGFFLNPLGCTATNTGVLSFVRESGI